MTDSEDDRAFSSPSPAPTQSDAGFQVDIPRDDQHGHADSADHEPGAEAGQCRQSIALPRGLQNEATLRQVQNFKSR